MTLNDRLKGFFHSKAGKLLPILLIALLIGSASSTVYVYYFVNSTATVQKPDVRLVSGTDVSASCTAYPCATETVAATYDFATLGFSLFPSATNSPQPATYYSNITTLHNFGTAAHSIISISLTGFTGVTNLGAITVYYCAAHTEFNPNGTPVTACTGSATITSASTGTVTLSGFGSPVSLPAGAASKGYIEVSAYALSTATVASTITFQITIEWV